MARIEHLNHHPDDSKRGLYLLDCDAFADIGAAVSQLPGKHFVTLLVADFSNVNQDDMVELARQLIAAGSRYFCVWGRNCEMAHLAFDLACCEFEADNQPVILTTDHSTESIEETIWFTIFCAYPAIPYEKDWYATVAVCVNDQTASQAVRKAFSAPATFSENIDPSGDEAT